MHPYKASSWDEVHFLGPTTGFLLELNLFNDSVQKERHPDLEAELGQAFDTQSGVRYLLIK